jgi:hypothetical protein
MSYGRYSLCPVTRGNESEKLCSAGEGRDCQDDSLLCETFKTEVYNMDALCNDAYERYCK